LALGELNQQILNCRKCRLWIGAKHAVPGEGPPNARIMLVGQNPGAEEDKTGRPFVGRSGKFLTKTLEEHGIQREDLFITNIVKHVTPQNRKPFENEVAACVPYLKVQISLIKPEIIVLVGASARETPRIEGIKYFEVVHPSAALRFTKMGEKFRSQIADLAQNIKQNEL
jgi:uracil-DNA glycosylase